MAKQKEPTPKRLYSAFEILGILYKYFITILATFILQAPKKKNRE